MTRTTDDGDKRINLSTTKRSGEAPITWLKKSDFFEKSDFYFNLGRTPNCSLVRPNSLAKVMNFEMNAILILGLLVVPIKG